MQKKANILDWPQKVLNPQIWNEDNTLKPEVKKFILDFIHSFAQANNFKDTFAWIIQVKFVGSLTTNLWNSSSDLDIHCEVDLSKFVEIEHPEMSKKEASDYLDGIRKQVDQVKAKVSGTEHPLEIFFENEFTNRASQQFSGTYSVLEDKWLVEPHIVGEDFDIATLHPDLLNLAKETASELDSAFGEIKRDVQDIKELNETINDWPTEQRELFEKKLQKRLDSLTKEIEELVVLREDVAEKRKHYDAISEQEVRFKYLQKYYYMHVLTDLKTLLKQSPELSTKDIPVVENIMQQANLKESAYKDMDSQERCDQVIMVDFDDTIVHENQDRTLAKPLEGAKEVLQDLKNQGYYIVIDSARANEWEGEDEIKEYLDKYDIPYDEIFQGNKPLAFRYIDDRAIQMTTWQDVLKKVEEAKQTDDKIDKECSPEKKANLTVTSPYGDRGTIFEDPTKQQADALLANSHDKILRWAIASDGHLYMWDAYFLTHPMAREALGLDWPLDDAGYYVGSTIPYKVGQYWKNKTVPVYAALDLPVIDHKTFNRKEPYALFIGTQMFSKTEGLDLFDVFGNHPMITESNRVPTVTLDTLIKENIPVIGKEPRAGDKQPFQDLSKVVKTAANYWAASNWASSAWISPTGQVFDLGRESHEDAIVELIGDPKIYDAEDANSYAIQKGWTRFGEMGGGMETGANVKSLRGINPAVFNHAIKYTGQNKEMVVADISGKYVKMPVDEFVLGQKEVNKAIQTQKTAQLGSEYDYSSTHFLLPKEIAEKIIRWAVENIPEEEIIHDSKDPGTKGIQLESHITLKYGLLTDDFEEVKKALEGDKAPHLKFSKTSFFEPEGKDYDVVVIPVESEDLQKLNEKLCSQVEHEDLQFKEYHPHVTVAYVKKGLGKKFDSKDIITGEELNLDVLTFSPKEGEKRELELVKRVEKEAEQVIRFDTVDGQEFRVFKDPSQNQAEQLLLKSHEKQLRYIIDDSSIYVWDAFYADHDDMKKALGIENINRIGYINDVKEARKIGYGFSGEKQSSFMPSNTDLAPSDDWAGTVGYPTNESMDAPQNVSDEETWYSPQNDRPRTKNFWQKMLSLFQKPLSKKEPPKNIVPVKEASSNVFMLETNSGLQTKALRDPTPEQAANLFNSTRGEVHQLRWFIPIDGHLYMWDAYDLTHWDAIKQIGIPATKLSEDMNTGIARTDIEAEIVAEEFKEFGIVRTSNKQAKQWATPKESFNQPGMAWGWADYIYNYVDENWQDFLIGWLNLNPKNYVKPAVIIEKIYEDEGRVSAWVHIEFVNTTGQSDAFMKLVISADTHYEPSYEPEGVETYESLENFEIEVLDYGKIDELEKTSGYGPTNYKGPSVADHGYQNSAWDDMNVTYSPEEDEELMDQNGKGGYPNRWMGRHRGPYYTNEGKVVKMLEETSALEMLPEQQPITENTNASTAIQMDDGSIYFSDEPHMIHVKLIKQLGLPAEHIVSGGRIVDGTYIDAGIMSDTMRYVERELARQRVEKKRQALGKKDIKADISGQIVNTVLQLIEQTGGATYNLSKGNLVGTDAYAVAIYPDREQIVNGVDYEILERYILDNEDLLSDPNNSFGAWISGNKVYLDVVATIKDKNQAMELGKKHKQLAIFSLKDLVEIPLQRVAKLAGVYSDKDQQAIYDKQFSDRWRDSSDPIDGGFEYYDYSQLNGNDYPSAKDLDKERALLDQLEKPIDRNMPTGLGEYAITYYDAFPAEGDTGGI